MPLQTNATIANPPSQLALNNLVETLAALLDEACALLGVGVGEFNGLGQLLVSHIEPKLWHALPQPVVVPRDHSCIWKVVAKSGRSDITAFCAHGAECPDLVPAEESAA